MKSDVVCRRLAFGALGGLLILMTGCVSTPPPTRGYVRAGPSYASLIPEVRRVGVITDAAVRYDRSGTNDYFCIDDSLAALTNIVRDAVAHLSAKGYEIAFAEPCFAGSFKESAPFLRVSQKRQDKPGESGAPFYTHPTLSGDQSYAEAVKRVVRRAYQAVANSGELPSDTFLQDPAIGDSLKVIAEKKQVDYLLVAVGEGLVVSAGKQVSQAVGSTLASIFITLGNASVTAHNVSFLDSWVALLDLKTGEVVWCNSLRLVGNPADQQLYNGSWSRFLLYHVPDRNPPKKT